MTDEALRDLGTSNQKAWLFVKLTQQTIFCRVSLPRSTPWRLHFLDSTNRLLCLLAFSWVWSMVGEEKREHKQHTRGGKEESWVRCLFPWIWPLRLALGWLPPLTEVRSPLRDPWVFDFSSCPFTRALPASDACTIPSYFSTFAHAFVIIHFIKFSLNYPNFLPRTLWYTINWSYGTLKQVF